MNRRLNRRLLAWTLGAVAVAAVFTIVMREIQIRRNATMMRQQAANALREGRLHKAAFYYDRYLAWQPHDTEALAGLACTLEKIAGTPGERYDAFLLMEQAVRRKPTDVELRKIAARLASAAFQHPAAIRHRQFLLKKAPNDAVLWIQLGQAQEFTSADDDAAQSYTNAVHYDPALLDAYNRLAHVLHYRLGRPREARKALDRMVKANSRSHEALLIRGKYLQTEGTRQDADRDVEKAYTLAPKNVEVILAAAYLQRRNGDPASARTILRQGLAEHPKESRLFKALAWAELLERKPEDAVIWLQKGLEENPESADLHVTLIDLLVSQKQTAQAQVELDKLREKHANPDIADCLQAQLWLQTGNCLKAVRHLEKIQGKFHDSPNWSAHVRYLLATGYRRLGDWERALSLYRQAIAISPPSPAARFGAASVLFDAGRIQEALDELQHINDSAETPLETPYLRARALLAKARTSPTKGTDLVHLKRAVQAVATYDPNNVEASLIQAEFHAFCGKTDSSRQILIDAQKQHPKNVKIRAQLAELCRRDGKPESSALILRDAKEELGVSAELRRAWARHWVAVGGRQGRDELAALANIPVDFSPPEQLLVQRTVAAALFRLGERAAAAKLWSEIAERYPNDLQCRFLLFDLALSQGDEGGARRIVAQLQRIEGQNGTLWRYGKAAVLANWAANGDRPSLQQARKLLREVKQLRPNWSRVAYLQGWIEEKAGHEESATRLYLAAARQGSLPLDSAARLARRLYEQRSFAEAALVLSRVERQSPLPLDLAKIAAEIAFRQKNLEHAARLAHQAIASAGGDYRVELWAARVLERAAEHIAAERVLRRLVACAPHIPQAWAALVELLSATGNARASATVLKRIPNEAPADRVWLTLARCHESLGQFDTALAMYEKHASESHPGFLAWRHLADFHMRRGQYDLAVPILRRLCNPADLFPPEITGPARRDLAVALARQEGPAEFQEALSLVPPDARNGDELVARALVLATRSEHQKEAIGLLEKADRKKRLRADIDFTLVQLYVTENDYVKASERLIGLIAANGEKPHYLVAYIDCLLHRRNVAEAGRNIERLRQQQPQNGELQRLETRLLKTQKQLLSQSS